MRPIWNDSNVWLSSCLFIKIHIEAHVGRRKGQKSESEASEENENGSNSDVDNDGEVSYSDLGYIPGARPTELLLSDEEQMEGEFIVDDDENDILPELPAEFSMRTFQVKAVACGV